MENLDEWADQALIASGLPPFQELGPMMEEELASPPPKIIDGPATVRLNDCWKIGEQYHQSRKHAQEGRKGQAVMPIPPILTSDDEFVHLAGGPDYGTFSDPKSWLRESNRLYHLVLEFIDACAI